MSRSKVNHFPAPRVKKIHWKLLVHLLSPSAPNWLCSQAPAICEMLCSPRKTQADVGPSPSWTPALRWARALAEFGGMIDSQPWGSPLGTIWAEILVVTSLFSGKTSLGETEPVSPGKKGTAPSVLTFSGPASSSRSLHLFVCKTRCSKPWGSNLCHGELWKVLDYFGSLLIAN